MMRIDCEFSGKNFCFRTNNDGSYLFFGLESNTQISTESGFNSLSRAKRYIREYLRYKYQFNDFVDRSDLRSWPRIKYVPSSFSEWKK